MKEEKIKNNPNQAIQELSDLTDKSFLHLDKPKQEPKIIVSCFLCNNRNIPVRETFDDPHGAPSYTIYCKHCNIGMSGLKKGKVIDDWYNLIRK